MNIKKLLPAVGIIIFIYLLSTIDLGKIITDFSRINPAYSILSFFSLVPILIMSNYQWQLILKKQKIDVSYLYSLKNILIGYFYGFITPGGYGAYARTLYLQDESKAPFQKCVSNVIIFNTIDYISLLLIGIIGGVILSIRFPHLVSLFIVIVVIFIIVIFMFLSFLKKGMWASFLKKIFQSKLFNPFREILSKSDGLFYENMPALKDLILPFFISFFGWILRFFELYLISKLFFIHVDIIYFIPIIAIANIIASLPITIYGLGTREVTLISLFSVFGVLPESVISLSLFWFVIVWLLPSILGAIIAIREGRYNGHVHMEKQF